MVVSDKSLPDVTSHERRATGERPTTKGSIRAEIHVVHSATADFTRNLSRVSVEQLNAVVGGSCQQRIVRAKGQIEQVTASVGQEPTARLPHPTHAVWD
jgi:hypothetical protein